MLVYLLCVKLLRNRINCISPPNKGLGHRPWLKILHLFGTFSWPPKIHNWKFDALMKQWFTGREGSLGISFLWTLLRLRSCIHRLRICRIVELDRGWLNLNGSKWLIIRENPRRVWNVWNLNATETVDDIKIDIDGDGLRCKSWFGDGDCFHCQYRLTHVQLGCFPI